LSFSHQSAGKKHNTFLNMSAHTATGQWSLPLLNRSFPRSKHRFVHRSHRPGPRRSGHYSIRTAAMNGHLNIVKILLKDSRISNTAIKTALKQNR
jgi:hypothetical protein